MRNKEPSGSEDEQAILDKVKLYMGPPPTGDEPPEAKPKKDKDKSDTTVIKPSDETPEELQNSIEASVETSIGAKAVQAAVTTDVAAVTEDPQTDRAVDEIMARESDEILAAEDAKRPQEKPAKTKLKDKFRHFFAAWWHNKIARYATIILLFLAVACLFVYPSTRYAILNTVGVRASASLKVIDDETQRPLKNVPVMLAGKTVRSDSDGKVRFSGLKLGKTKLVIKKLAFAPIAKDITLGWGSNPLSTYELVAIGAQYEFSVTDFLSTKPISDVEAVYGESSASADDKGKIVLTIEPTEADKIDITFQAENYRKEKITVATDNKTDNKIKLVPAKPDIFVSKRSGKYDLYKIDVDGKNEKKLLAGTGSEKADGIVVLPSPDGKVVAFVSSREGKRNGDGFVLSGLYIVNTNDGSFAKVVESERIDLTGWFDSRLVYIKVIAGASASNPKRQRILSYDYKTKADKELASANYFYDVLADNSYVYYSPTNLYAVNPNDPVRRVSADGVLSNIFDKSAYNLFRAAYDKIVINGVDGFWYSYAIGSQSKATKLEGQPADLVNRLYVNSPNNSRSAWVDSRDGKGALILYNISKKEDEKPLISASGVTNPVRWLDDKHVVYRVSSGSETADYVMSIEGGPARKIVDVHNTQGAQPWYYY